MQQSEAQKPAGRGHSHSGLKVAVVALVVAVIILSGISVSYYRLSKDYHDAKYKAQYATVTSLIFSVNNLPSAISAMMDTSDSLQTRQLSCSYAQIRAYYAFLEADTLAAMYPMSSSEWDSFDDLGGCFLLIETFPLQDYYYHLGLAIADNASYESNTTVSALFETLNSELNNMTELLNAGIDTHVSAQTHPYSLVNRMDLPAIRNVTTAMVSIAHELDGMLRILNT